MVKNGFNERFKILVSPADLWPGATRQHALQVVTALQEEGYKAERHKAIVETNIAGVLALADTFRQAVVDTAETAVQRAIEHNQEQRRQEIERARTAVVEAQRRRDAAQETLETAVAQLHEVEARYE